MTPLAQQRCAEHPHREAVSRCPGCGRFCCRECVTEHNERLLCSACLGKLVTNHQARRARWGNVAIAGLSLAGFMMAWSFFYYVGQLLMTIPTSFHQGR